MSVNGISPMRSYLPQMIRNTFQNITLSKVVKIAAPLLIVLVALYVLCQKRKPHFSITSIFGDLNKLPKFRAADVYRDNKINFSTIGDTEVFLIEHFLNPPSIGLQYVRTYPEDIRGSDNQILIPKGTYRSVVVFFQRDQNNPSSWVPRDQFKEHACFFDSIFSDPQARDWMVKLLAGERCGRPQWKYDGHGLQMSGEYPLQKLTLQRWNRSIQAQLWNPG